MIFGKLKLQKEEDQILFMIDDHWSDESSQKKAAEKKGFYIFIFMPLVSLPTEKIFLK